MHSKYKEKVRARTVSALAHSVVTKTFTGNSNRQSIKNKGTGCTWRAGKTKLVHGG
jgi:hypothetical protein